MPTQFTPYLDEVVKTLSEFGKLQFVAVNCVRPVSRPVSPLIFLLAKA